MQPNRNIAVSEYKIISNCLEVCEILQVHVAVTCKQQISTHGLTVVRIDIHDVMKNTVMQLSLQRTSNR